MTAASNHNWFDTESGILDRRIFADEEIYREELQKIFGRAWNFMCHESQIPETGDFFMNWIGEDEVIIVRDGDGVINVLLNSCPHRGNTVCRAELGNTKSFVCSYHGWNYDLNGRLIGMPSEELFYRNPWTKTTGVWHLPQKLRVTKGSYLRPLILKHPR